MLAFGERGPAAPLARLHGAHDRRSRRARRRSSQTIRERGWADAYEERELGLNAIAAPVFSDGGSLAAILALQGPIPRFGRNAARAALPLLLEAAGAISRELGWRPD